MPSTFAGKLTPKDESKILLFTGQDNESIMQYRKRSYGGRSSSPSSLPGTTVYAAFSDDRSHSLAGLALSI
jgi:hypothetical protein